jgi:hypothetical protein
MIPKYTLHEHIRKSNEMKMISKSRKPKGFQDDKYVKQAGVKRYDPLELLECSGIYEGM